MEKNKPKIDCYKCKHYFVTWDERFPHGCRAMKFKGKTLPSAVVLTSSKMPCMLFANKKQPDTKLNPKPSR